MVTSGNLSVSAHLRAMSASGQGTRDREAELGKLIVSLEGSWPDGRRDRTGYLRLHGGTELEVYRKNNSCLLRGGRCILYLAILYLAT